MVVDKSRKFRNDLLKARLDALLLARADADVVVIRSLFRRTLHLTRHEFTADLVHGGRVQRELGLTHRDDRSYTPPPRPCLSKSWYPKNRSFFSLLTDEHREEFHVSGVKGTTGERVHTSCRGWFVVKVSSYIRG